MPYLEQRFLQLIGKDRTNNDTASWFSSLQRTAILQASHVQCIGMHRPLLLREIYQPTRLKVRGPTNSREKLESFPHQDKVSRSIAQAGATEERVIRVTEFVKRGENAIIYAGPGWEKQLSFTMFFLSRYSDKNYCQSSFHCGGQQRFRTSIGLSRSRRLFRKSKINLRRCSSWTGTMSYLSNSVSVSRMPFFGTMP